jgi:hypothetical protein
MLPGLPLVLGRSGGFRPRFIFSSSSLDELVAQGIKGNGGSATSESIHIATSISIVGSAMEFSTSILSVLHLQ